MIEYFTGKVYIPLSSVGPAFIWCGVHLGSRRDDGGIYWEFVSWPEISYGSAVYEFFDVETRTVVEFKLKFG